MCPAITWQVAAVGAGREHHGENADDVEGRVHRVCIRGGGELRAGLPGVQQTQTAVAQYALC
jgi:hypothetical protein